MSLSCFQALNNDPSDTSKNEDDKLSYFGKQIKGIGAKLLSKLGYDGKGLGKRGQVIQNPIQIQCKDKK